MNSQDLHNLQEAYLDVYELDEDGWQPPTQKKADKMMKQASKLHRTASERGEPGNPEAEKKHTQASKIYFMSRRMSDKAKERDNEAKRKEFVKEDLYDIILSHLLDEGYADTQEQAEAIMVNMSEDWRESIVEEVLDEKIATPPSRYNMRRRLDPEKRRLRRSSDFHIYGGENQDPDERTISTSKGEGGITKNPKKLRKQKAMGEHG
jgi:hypothetical protein